MRLALTTLALFTGLAISAQQMDSIHVYRRVPVASCTSAKANAMAWDLFRQGAPHRTLMGSELNAVHAAMGEYRSHRHTYATLPGPTHLAMAFSGGRPLAFGVTEDLGLVVNFTMRTEYRITTWTQHLAVRAILSRLVVE